jgi:threonine/homoserine/homoserine lactone efflux protein
MIHKAVVSIRQFGGGFLFGLTLQLAIGPVFLAVLHKAVREGFWESLKMIIGVALTDAFYITVSFTGVGRLLRVPLLRTVIHHAGAGVLIFFGCLYLLNAGKSRNMLPAGEASAAIQDKTVMKAVSLRSFGYGVQLTLTNPLTIIFWSGTFGALIASRRLPEYGSVLCYSVGCITATLVFLTLAAWVGKQLMTRLHQKILQGFDYGVGLFLIVFGAVILIK